jgi:hypothetical protein
MIRKTMKVLLVALVAAFALASTAEAAPKKVVRPRAKHSSRVASGAPATTPKKPAIKKKPTVAARQKSAPSASASTAKKPAVKKPAPAKRTPATKPR